jgi:FkbM family methyltransferase
MKQRLRILINYLTGLLTKKLNGQYIYALIVKTDNGLFAVDPEDSVVGRQLRVNGSYGTGELDIFRKFCTPDSKVLIVGAHIGSLAIPISRLCKEVVAIEANPYTYSLLQKNISLNEVSNCQALNIAASNKNETIQFLLNRSNSGGSKRVPLNKEYMYYYDNPKEISVEAYNLDEYLKRDDFDMTIIDIEGSEYFALQGMQKILSNTELLMIEFLPHHLRNVSGASVEQFISLITPHFSSLTIPTKNLTVDSQHFYSHLMDMYNNNQEDEGLIFRKA